VSRTAGEAVQYVVAHFLRRSAKLGHIAHQFGIAEHLFQLPRTQAQLQDRTIDHPSSA
jgi:hypothetical protein